jgi:hypothetical protein
MPVLLHGKPRNPERAQQHAKVGRSRQRFADVSLRCGDQIASGKNRGQAEKAGQFQPDLPREVLRCDGALQLLVAGIGASADVGFRLIHL